MTMWTEAEIKQYLDGNFWFFDHEGRLHHKPVLPDHIPDHNGKAAFASYGNLAALNSSKQVDWPANAVEIIRDIMRRSEVVLLLRLRLRLRLRCRPGRGSSAAY